MVLGGCLSSLSSSPSLFDYDYDYDYDYEDGDEEQERISFAAFLLESIAF